MITLLMLRPLMRACLAGITVVLFWSAVYSACRSHVFWKEKMSLVLSILQMIMLFVLLEGQLGVILGIAGYQFIWKYYDNFGRCPAWLMMSILAVIGLWQLIAIYRKRVKWKLYFTDMSVWEGMETLTGGLCYYWDSGQVEMVNSCMNNICRTITGHSLTDGKKFWDLMQGVKPEDISKMSRRDRKTRMEVTNSNVVIYNVNGRDLLKMPDQTVYSFRKNRIYFQKDYINELIAVDITEEYRLREKLMETNHQLDQMNAKMREFGEVVTQTTIEKEVLTTKLKVHDDIGNLLISAKKYLISGDETVNRSELVMNWKKNLYLILQQNPQEETNHDAYRSVLKAAEDVGIAVEIDGELPSGPLAEKLISAAINECLTNTFRHAHGDRMWIRVDDREDWYLISFTNNGNPPKQEIRETGGLSNLRRLVENEGCMMKVQSQPYFQLTLSILKE